MAAMFPYSVLQLDTGTSAGGWSLEEKEHDEEERNEQGFPTLRGHNFNATPSAPWLGFGFEALSHITGYYATIAHRKMRF